MVFLVEMMVVDLVASRWVWLSLLGVINPLAGGPSPPRTVVTFEALFRVSVTWFFLRGEVVSPTPNPQPGGPGAAFRLVSPLRPARHG